MLEMYSVVANVMMSNQVSALFFMSLHGEAHPTTPGHMIAVFFLLSFTAVEALQGAKYILFISKGTDRGNDIDCAEAALDNFGERWEEWFTDLKPYVCPAPFFLRLHLTLSTDMFRWRKYQQKCERPMGENNRCMCK